MGKPRRKGKRAETPGASGLQGKLRLQQVKKPVKSSVFKRKKKGPSPGQQGGSRVTRAAKQKEPYDNHFQACMNEGSRDEVAGLRDNGGIGGGDLLTVPVKIEEWKGKVEEGLGNEFSDDDDDGGIVVDIPPTIEIKEERMSDAELNEVVTEEGLRDLMMDDVSEDEEPSSESVVNRNGDGPGSSSEGVLCDVPAVNEVDVGELSGSKIPAVPITEGDTMIDVFESVEEEKVNDDLIDKASLAAMEVNDANEDDEAAAVSNIFPEVIAQALPHVLKQLEKKELLNCRVVCKDWCETVDYYLENNPIYYPYRHDVTKEKNLRSVWDEDLISSDNLCVARFPMTTTTFSDVTENYRNSTGYSIDARRVALNPENLYCTRFRTVASLSDFKNEFEKSSRNPFVGRLVCLEPATFGAPVYWKEAREMASKLGKHIRILKIYTPGDDSMQLYVFYGEIRKFLRVVPELKYLEIQHDRRCKIYEYVERNFISFAEQNPLPNLPQLETLVLTRNLENVLKMVLLQRYGAQVGKLVSDFQEWNFNAALSLSELRMINVPNLISLFYKVFTPMQAANLQNLELHFSVQDCVPVNQLFKGLQQFTSLKAVSIAFIPECCLRERCKGCVKCCEYMSATLIRNSRKALLPMILPSVESFKLVTISPCLTFQFLKSLPQLKYFHLKCEIGHLHGIREDEEDIGMELKNLVYGEGSQLWKLLPTLKQVKINDRMEYNRPLVRKSKNPWISNFDKVLRHLFCEFENTELLKLRVVCPAWKSAIENFFDNQRIERPYFISSFKQVQLARNYGLPDHKSFPSTSFSTSDDLSKIKKDASEKGSENNPFWFRSISLKPKYYRCDLFWNAVEHFLKMFGHHVWLLSLSLFTKDELFMYKKLHRCLQNLPNLKSLKFCAYSPEEEEPPENAEDGNQFIKENPLPTMEHLDTLCFSGNISLARKTVNALLMKYSGQLKRLDINWSGTENWPINFGDLPKLVHLKLDTDVLYKELPTVLWSLKAPNLQHLDLYSSGSIDQQFLFKLLKPLKLRSLRLCFTRTLIFEPSYKVSSNKECRLYSSWDNIEKEEFRYSDQINDNPIITFPSVEHLYARVCHKEQSLRFLRCFPSLKYLQLVRYADPLRYDNLGMELMKCKNGSEAVKQSKIWDMFPKLKEIQLIAEESTFVDRAGYFYVSERPFAVENEYFRLIVLQ